MKKFEEYEMKYSGLSAGMHEFDFHITGSFFELFDYHEFHDANVEVKLKLNKMSTMMELEFQVKGTVNVNCDITNVPYDQAIEDSLFLKVKFGQEYNDEDDELLVLPHGEHKIEVQQYIYEAIVLAVPAKKVHPKVLDGTMESEILDKLEELSPGNKKESKNNNDPRWDKLKELLNEN